MPEKIPGWAYIPLVDPLAGAAATYLGSARGLKDWTSYDNQIWIAIGTHVKLYLVNNGVLYDITPIRSSSNLNNALSTIVTTPTVTVVDVGHKANTGDYIDFPLSVSIGGLTLLGTYQVTVVDPNSYTITASSNATGTVNNGGGAVSINYEMYTGLASNGQLLGYGTGVYGASTYGTPRAAGTGVPARLRSWSLDNYGQDLIASESDGEIYLWQKIGGPNSRAAIIPAAPQNVQRCLVDAASRVVMALGCTDVTSNYDPLLVAWCTLDDIFDWVPTATNTAGDYQLTSGSRIVTGLKTKGQNLIWTDNTLYRMVYVGGTDIYDFYPAGRCYIVGPNAAVDVDGVAYFMGFDNIYNYTGTLNLQACDVWETVFDPNLSTSLNRTQAEKVQCFTLETKTEITWLYPSIGGSGECDRYVTLNWEDNVWYAGAWTRTCAAERSGALGFPYGVNAGFLYQHEVGTDAVEKTGTVAIPWYMESLDITIGGAKSEYTMGGSDARFTIGGSDSHLRVFSILPDWQYMTGSMNITLKSKDRPQDASYVISGPVAFTSSVGQVDIDAHGSQIVIRLDGNTGSGGTPALGSSFRMGVMQGLAVPYAKR
jgi:hypothetical protein